MLSECDPAGGDGGGVEAGRGTIRVSDEEKSEDDFSDAGNTVGSDAGVFDGSSGAGSFFSNSMSLQCWPEHCVRSEDRCQLS